MNFDLLYECIVELESNDMPPAGKMLESLMVIVDHGRAISNISVRTSKTIYNAWVRKEASKLSQLWDYVTTSAKRSETSRSSKLNMLKKLMRTFKPSPTKSRSSSFSSSPPSSTKRSKKSVNAEADDTPDYPDDTEAEEISVDDSVAEIIEEPQTQTDEVGEQTDHMEVIEDEPQNIDAAAIRSTAEGDTGAGR